MRLLFISDVNAVHARRWAGEMVRRGHEVVFLSVRPGELPDVEVIYRDPGDVPGQKWLRLFRHLRFLWLEWRLIRVGGFDIVHVHYLRADLIGWVASWHPRSVISVWGSDIRMVEEGGDPRRIGFRQKALRGVAAVTATNRYLAECVTRFAPDCSQIDVIPFGVDITHFNRERWVSSADGTVRFCVVKPRMMPLYGYDLVIQAIGEVVEEFNNISLVLVGSGDTEYREELEELVAELRLDSQVNFQEQVSYSDMPSIFQYCDVLLQPSRWESFGVVILEAGAMGVPAIASDVGGVSKLLKDGVTGILVPPEDIKALSKAMLRMAVDIEFRSSCGENSFQMVRSEYNFTSNADDMERLYHRLVTGEHIDR